MGKQTLMPENISRVQTLNTTEPQLLNQKDQ
jgi:hypothetical protein